MEIEMSAFGLLFLVALAFATYAINRRSDVLHGTYSESDFNRRFAAIAQL